MIKVRQIKHFLYTEFILPIRNQWHIYLEKKAFRRSMKYADHLSETHNGKKYVVMKNYDGNFQVINKDDFKLYKLPRRGRFDKRTTWQDILRDCSYETKN